MKALLGKNLRVFRIQVLIWAGALIAVGAAAANAGDPAYVMRNGKKVRLIKSDTELAVTFRDTEQVKGAARRLAAVGSGIVEDVPYAPHARTKILRVANTGKQRRSRVRQDTSIEAVRPVYRFEGSDIPVLSSGTIALKLEPGLDAEARAAMFRDYRVEIIEEVEGLHDVFLVRPADGEDEDEVWRAEALASDHRTQWAHPNLIRSRELRQTSVQDPYYDQQWHLNNTGSMGGQAGADINAPEAWVLSEGADVLIGVFDDSIDVDHPDLRDGYINKGHDASLQSNDDGYNDPHPKQFGDAHGTAVLGLACAQANEIGVRGVAYLSRFTASRGLMELLTEAQTASVYTFARQENVGVHINSWGNTSGINSPIVEEALITAFEEGRTIGDDAYGMVILFSSGNDGDEITAGSDYSTVPQVIGVGASTVEDRLATYSNYGPNVNVLAPSGDDFLAALATTDVEDEAGYPEIGYNRGGFTNDLEMRLELDPDGNYTKWFSGTSAACPVAAGVAALVVGRNQVLSATDVKAIMEHTCVKIAPTEANYGQATQRSATYGYGRLDAYAAVQAAEQANNNGGFTWPNLPTNLSISGTTLRWQESDFDDGRNEVGGFLVVESDNEFTFWPEDGACYDCDQSGCSPGGVCDEDNLAELPDGVSILSTGRVSEKEQNVEFTPPTGRKFFAIYARNALGRYSFGADINSDGDPWDEGSATVPGSGSDNGDTPDPIDPGLSKPAVTVFATPLEGLSPLKVTFAGNAVSSNQIDESRTAWDFDISDAVTVDANTRNAIHTYEVGAGETRTFIARLTMYDSEGNSGSASVAIKVDGGGDTSSQVGENDVNILVGVPGTPGSDVDTGTSPLDVELNIDATSLTGTLQSVLWDLGDGSTARSIVVPHTYINDTEETLVFPITATVTTATSAQSTITTVASRRITVFPSTGEDTQNGDSSLDGTGTTGVGGAAGCGIFGMIPLIVMPLSLVMLRLRRTRG